MKYTFYLLIFILWCFVLGCAGDDGSNGANGQDGVSPEPCYVTQLEDGTYINCPDSEAFIPAEEEEEVIVCKHHHHHPWWLWLWLHGEREDECHD